MKLALISDVHANLEALQAVLGDIDASIPGARIVCAGDIVGYGPDPEACIDLLRSRGVDCIYGNHDEMVLGTRDFSRCVYAGITAAVWTRKVLSERALTFLASLPPRLEAAPEVIVCHGDLLDADTYVSDETRARRALAQLAGDYPRARVLVCGHTHHAAVFSPENGFSRVPEPGRMTLPGESPAVVNPGAVGQSRDGKPVARYASLDTKTRELTFREVEYEYQATLSKLRRAGLVAQVVMLRPRGVRRYLEGLRVRLARLRVPGLPAFRVPDASAKLE